MASILPHTRFGPNFKHAKVVEIVIGDMESLSTYPHYWNYHLVPQILSGKFYCYFKLTQGCTCTQVECHHSDLGGSTNGVHSLMLLTPPNVLINPVPYTEVPKQPCNPMVASINLVNLVLKWTNQDNSRLQNLGCMERSPSFGRMVYFHLEKLVQKCGYLVLIITRHEELSSLL